MASIVSAGTTSATALNMSADTSGVLQLASNNGTVGLTLNTSQNVGIGTASPSFGLSVEKDNGSGYIALFRKSVSDVALTIQTTGSITQIQGLNAALSAVNNIALQISGGNVGVGTASPSIADFNASSAVLQGNKSDTNGFFFKATSSNAALILGAGNAVAYIATTTNSPIIFQTNTTERARFSDSGEFLVGTTTTPVATYNCFSENGADVQLILQRVGDGGGYGGIGASFANALNVYGSISGLSQRFFVTQAGSCLNVTGSYGTISDLKIKENIENARDYLTDLCRVRVVKYSLKEDKRETPDKLGVIAQELEQIFPHMIEEVQDVANAKEILDTKTKTVKYSVFVPMLLKAIQELNAKVTALENK